MVAMRADKHCEASGKALKVESAVSEIQRVKIHLRKTLQNRSKCMHENTHVCSDEFATVR